MTGGSGSSEGGQPSEVSSMEAQDSETPIAPEDAVAGYPEGESGEPDEGPAGPNANTHKGADRPHRDPEDENRG